MTPFFTTVRIQRAKASHLDAVLSTPKLQELHGSTATVLEVTAHGQPVAVVTVDADDAIEVHWTHSILGDTPDTTIAELVRAARCVMDDAARLEAAQRPQGVRAVTPHVPPKRIAGGKRAA